MPKFLLSSLREALAAGHSTHLLSLAVAGWMRYLAGIDENNVVYNLNDPLGDRLQKLARESKSDPRPLLGQIQIFGDLGTSEVLVAQIGGFLSQLYSAGSIATLIKALA